MRSHPRAARRLGAAAMIGLLVQQPALAPADVPPPPSYPENPVRPTTAPIALPGGGGVSDGGAATYSIPLQVPAGVHGMQPALSINYGGGLDNGPLGVGMHLSVGSVITPCNQTIASEGHADGVDFDRTDAYCLDGSKLVLYADPDHPSTQTEVVYHTEIESFARIVARFPDPAGSAQPVQQQPTSFVVHERDGRTRTYEAPTTIRGGQWTNSSAVGPSAISTELFAIAYVLTHEEDANLNRIDYAYDNDNAASGETSYRLRTITYSNGRRQIQLGYETRPDPLVGYVNGVKIVSRSRVSTIEAWAPNPITTQKVWTYHLSYLPSPDTGRSLLWKVKLCDQTGGCSWERAFDWTRASTTVEDTVLAGGGVFDGMSMGYAPMYWEQLAAHEPDGQTWIKPSDVRVILYDVDADGDDDVLYRTQPTRLQLWNETWGPFTEFGGLISHNGEIRLRLSSDIDPMDYDVTMDLEPGWANPWCAGCTKAMAHLGKSRIGDVDGDGDLDLVLARTLIDEDGGASWQDDPGSDWYNFDRWSFGFTTYHGRTFDHFADHPFDLATPDLELVKMRGPVARYTAQVGGYLAVITPPFQRVLADLDGDGRVERLESGLDSQDPIDVLDFQGVDWNDPVTPPVTGQGFPYHAPVSSDDFDASFGLHWTCSNGQARVADVNGDGRQDVLAATDVESSPTLDPATGFAGVYTRLSLGDPVISTSPHGIGEAVETSMLFGGDCGAHDPDLVLGDWNGDGLKDALYPPGSYVDPLNTTLPNTLPVVRWNLGTGFGPAENIAVTGGGNVTALMEQRVPEGRDGSPVPWDRGTRVADVDGDGRDDIIAFRQDNALCVDPVDAAGGLPSFTCGSTKIMVYRPQGDHFVGAELWSGAGAFATLNSGFTTSQIGDVDGDGAIDVVHVQNGALHALELPWRSTPDRLAAVRDSSTAFELERFTYTRAWWGDKPRAEANAASPTGPAPCAWPVACVRHGFEVVRQHDVFAGTDATGAAMYRTSLHHYADPRVSQLGRGHLGFASHEVWHRETGSWMRRTFDNTTVYDATPGDGTPRLPDWRNVFYPGAGAVDLEIAITPRAPVPTAFELAAPGVGPGLDSGEVIDVRTRWTSVEREVFETAGERSIVAHPTFRSVDNVENQAVPELSTTTPTYLVISPVGAGSHGETTSQYDAWGNVTFETTTTSVGLGAPARMTQTTSATYDNLTDGTWQLGLTRRIATYAYDADDVERPGRVIRTSYDAATNPEVIEMRATDATFHPCMAAGNPAESCELRSTTTTLVQDSHGNVTSATVAAFDDPTPRQTQTVWDSEGVYPVQTIDPLDFATSTLIHPALGVPIVTVDELGTTGTMTYDGFGRLLTATRPGTATLTRAYLDAPVNGEHGLKASDSSTDGSAGYVRTDQLGRTVEAGVRGLGGAWSYTDARYDLFGNVVREGKPSPSVPSSGWTTTDYDRLGQVLARTTPDQQTTVFEPGLLASTTQDPLGHQQYVLRDIGGRVIESGHDLGGGTTYGTVRFRHAAFDQVEATIDAEDHEVTLEYDAFGRVKEAHDPDLGKTASAYNGFGELVSQTTATDDEFAWQYDALGRVTYVDGPDGPTVHIYDTGANAARRPTRSISPDAVFTDFAYDSFGRPWQTTQTVDGVARSLVQRYDGNGRPSVLFYPVVSGFDRFAISYTYADGLLSTIKDVSACHLSTSYNPPPQFCVNPPIVWQVQERDVRFQPTRAAYGNGVTDGRAYDPDMGRLTQINANGVVTNYSYDEEGQLKTRTDYATSRTETFAYDDLHRLTAWTVRPPRVGGLQPLPKTTTYDYDELGNLDQVKRGSTVTFSATFNAQDKPHALAWSSTHGNYTYDARGRQISGAGRTIDWSQFDLPSQITTGSSPRTFTYDAFGSRATRADASGTVTYVGGVYEHRALTSGTVDTFLVRGETGLVAQVDYASTGKTVRYIVPDSLGNPSIVMTGTTNTERAYFDPFGGRVTASGNGAPDADPTTSVGFTGHEEDGNGLINMRGRIYDREQYRFLSPDPFINNPLFGQSYNRYAYVNNNPLNFTDPSGFQSVENDDDWDDSADPDWEYRDVPGETSTNRMWRTKPPKCEAASPCTDDDDDGANAPVANDDGDAVAEDDDGGDYYEPPGFRGDYIRGVGLDKGDPVIKGGATLIAWHLVPGVMTWVSVAELLTVGGHDDPRFAELMTGAAGVGKYQPRIAPGTGIGVKKFFWDPRSWRTVSRERWAARGGANGNSIDHWLLPQKAKWIPQGLRNAGFNLVIWPKSSWLTKGKFRGDINIYMGLAVTWGPKNQHYARALGLRIATTGAVPGIAFGGLVAGYLGATEVLEDDD